MMQNYTKYKKGYYLPPVIDLSWAKKEYPEHAPVWCSVDLRDGNQSLIIPMSQNRLQGNRGWVPCGLRYRI